MARTPRAPRRAGRQSRRVEAGNSSTSRYATRLRHAFCGTQRKSRALGLWLLLPFRTSCSQTWRSIVARTPRAPPFNALGSRHGAPKARLLNPAPGGAGDRIPRQWRAGEHRTRLRRAGAIPRRGARVAGGRTCFPGVPESSPCAIRNPASTSRTNRQRLGGGPDSLLRRIVPPTHAAQEQAGCCCSAGAPLATPALPARRSQPLPGAGFSGSLFQPGPLSPGSFPVS